MKPCDKLIILLGGKKKTWPEKVKDEFFLANNLCAVRHISMRVYFDTPMDINHLLKEILLVNT